MEWLGIAFFWPEQGAEHSHLMMNEELSWFAENVTHSLLMTDPAGKLEIILHQTWQWVFIDSGFIPWLEQLRNRPDNAWLYWIDTYIQASVWITLTFVLRVFILLLAAPLFFWRCWWGWLTGWCGAIFVGLAAAMSPDLFITMLKDRSCRYFFWRG